MSPDTELQLYSYYRSSAAYRVRIVLALKGLSWKSIPVNLLKGEQKQAGYLQHNPQGLVPALRVQGTQEDAGLITQSLAIIEYLEECHSHPSIMPSSAMARAQARSLAQQVAMDIHPLNNPRVTQYLQQTLGADESQKTDWYQHWIAQGFGAFERNLEGLARTGDYCIGNSVTVADICLIPQVYNALRFNCSMQNYPLINAIYKHCTTMPAFIAASPESQPDCSV